MKRTLCALLLLASIAVADGYRNAAVAVTQASQTLTFVGRDSGAAFHAKSVAVTNPSTNADEVYFWIFTTAETATDATTADQRLDPGNSATWNFDPLNETGLGYDSLSIIAAAGKTPTVYVVAK